MEKPWKNRSKSFFEKLAKSFSLSGHFHSSVTSTSSVLEYERPRKYLYHFGTTGSKKKTGADLDAPRQGENGRCTVEGKDDKDNEMGSRRTINTY